MVTETPLVPFFVGLENGDELRFRASSKPGGKLRVILAQARGTVRTLHLQVESTPHVEEVMLVAQVLNEVLRGMGLALSLEGVFNLEGAKNEAASQHLADYRRWTLAESMAIREVRYQIGALSEGG